MHSSRGRPGPVGHASFDLPCTSSLWGCTVYRELFSSLKYSRPRGTPIYENRQRLKKDEAKFPHTQPGGLRLFGSYADAWPCSSCTLCAVCSAISTELQNVCMCVGGGFGGEEGRGKNVCVETRKYGYSVGPPNNTSIIDKNLSGYEQPAISFDYLNEACGSQLLTAQKRKHPLLVLIYKANTKTLPEQQHHFHPKRLCIFAQTRYNMNTTSNSERRL